ncbi:hypothetical protein BRSU_2237 [Brachyspira suanatina]|uniref:Uncharacterized protein n=1 Tax=Brachyspira suanatina TaxID=381802 RepID=A0A0G4K9D2_9SPIR|nr:hypothetical protein [Brachyspira suanatina]CRF34771.1 hypothetical protein BRSU_2237 [Brachyspira suanatina]
MDPNIIDNLPDILKNNMDTFKKTSEDFSKKDNPEYMTDCEYSVINFDEVTKEYKRNNKINMDPKSNDALYIDDENLYFIEFKNGYFNVNFNVNHIKGSISNAFIDAEDNKTKEKIVFNNFKGSIKGGFTGYCEGSFNTNMNSENNYNFDGSIEGYSSKCEITDKNTNEKYNIRGDIKGNFRGYINGNTILDDLKTKIYDSLFVLSNIKHSNGDYYIENILDFSRKNIIYIAVYNEENNPKTRQSHFKKRANMPEITKRYNMDKILSLKNFIFKEVYLYSKEQFRMNFIDKIKI